MCFSSSLGIPGKTMGTLFTPIPVAVTAYEPERVGGMFIVVSIQLSDVYDVINIKFMVLCIPYCSLEHRPFL